MTQAGQTGAARPLQLLVAGEDEIAEMLRAGCSEDADARRLRSQLRVAGERGARVDILRQARAGAPGDQPAPRFDVDRGGIDDPFASRLFVEPPDAVVLALRPNVTDVAWRHREHGYLVSPAPDWPARWSDARRSWFSECFEPLGRLEPREFEDQLALLVAAIRATSAAAVLVVNCSSFDPADSRFAYRGLADDSLSLRVHRFNLGLLEVSGREGVSIVDADRILGEMGAGRHVLAPFRYSIEGWQAVGRECLRILDELGVHERTQADARNADPAARIFRVALPFVTRAAQHGVVVRWHKRVGDRIRPGDDLVDVDMRVDGWPFRLRDGAIRRLVETGGAAPGDEAEGRTPVMSIRVCAGDAGYLRRVIAGEGSAQRVDDLLAVVTRDADSPLGDAAALPPSARAFKVACNIVS
jgi:hypothetical protein